MSQARRLLAAFSLLTAFPVGGASGGVPPALWAFPLVGAFIGGMLVGVDLAARAVLPHGPASWIVLAAWVAATGAIHVDGLADTADGLLGHGTAAKRLEIMADPRTGAFGAAAVALLLLGKWSLLASLDGSTRTLSLLFAPFLARAELPLALELARPAREGGMAWALARDTARWERWLALFLASAAALALFPVALLLASAAAGTIALLVMAARRAVGGVTGDILGGAVELAELAALVAAVIAAEEGWW